MKLASRLDRHVETNRSGMVLAAETGFKIYRDTVRAPDVSFVARERVQSGGPPEVQSKVGMWLEAWVRLV